MNITLSPDLEQIVSQNLRSGRYHSADEVIGASLRLLQEQEAREALRREIALGIEQADQGQVRSFDAEDLKRRLWEAVPGVSSQS